MAWAFQHGNWTFTASFSLLVSLANSGGLTPKLITQKAYRKRCNGTQCHSLGLYTFRVWPILVAKNKLLVIFWGDPIHSIGRRCHFRFLVFTVIYHWNDVLLFARARVLANGCVFRGFLQNAFRFLALKTEPLLRNIPGAS